HRLGIGLGIAHATAHVGVEGHPDMTQQHLARSGRRYRRFHQAEVLGHRRTHRAGGKQYLAVAVLSLGHAGVSCVKLSADWTLACRATPGWSTGPRRADDRASTAAGMARRA